MAVCERYRIPHSQFLRWSADDRSKAVAYRLREASRCRSCGTRPEEWDPKRGGRPDAYEAHLSRCKGCQAIARKQEDIADKPIGHGRHGVYVTLRPS